MTAPDLSIVVPAYNEAERLPESLRLIEPYLASLTRSYELILVNDGSRDQTSEVMRREAAAKPEVKVVDLERNRGKGRALAAGVAVSTGRLVLMSDADFSAPIEELDKLEAALDSGADVAIASRAKKGKVILVSQPAHRVLMGKIFNLMVQVLLLPGLWDTQCGFKLFRGDDARQIFGKLETDGFAFDVEVLYRARRMGRRIVEVPVRWQHSAPTRVVALRHSVDMFKDLIKLRLSPPS